MRERIARYFYRLLAKYIGFHIVPGSRVCEVNPKSDFLGRALGPQRVENLTLAPPYTVSPGARDSPAPRYLILNGTLHFEEDPQLFLESLHGICDRRTRVILCYYNSVWEPLVWLSTWLGLRAHLPERNWISPSDVRNLTALSHFETVHETSRVLLPVWIPVLSDLVNRWLAPLPVFRWFALLSLVVLRPLKKDHAPEESVSVVIPARNEAGNIDELVRRIPRLGPRDEIIIVEGGSGDGTWQTVQEVQRRYPERSITIAQQSGKGKADAVRLGFSLAQREILMILDADISVPPEDLAKFYKVLAEGIGEFVNGSRLVFPVQEKAMQFFNKLGNRFFAIAFSFLLSQPLKDTLCGTKVLRREDYADIAGNREYFGDFDPFGDFDLLFGASRLGLRIVEVPIRYQARRYGETNIQRWRHGLLLLRMVVFAARKVKFIG